MKGIVWGFTATQRGMTPAQRATVRRLLSHPLTPAIELHHGDCVGGDEEADELCEELCIDTVIHPPTDPKKRAWRLKRWIERGEKGPGRRSVVEVEPRPYLDRNRDIVDAAASAEYGALISAPYEFEMQLRSGTWATTRYADKRRATLRLVLPDGRVERFL